MRYNRTITIKIQASFANKEYDTNARKALGYLLHSWNHIIRVDEPNNKLKIDASWLDTKPKKKLGGKK